MNLRRNISRRRMIEGASAAALVTAAAATVPAAMASPEAAASGPGLPKGNWRIDTHAHYSPDVYNDYLKRYGLLGAITGAYGPWSVDRHLAFMDQYRIQASVLSFGDLQVTVGPVDDRRATARAVNDYAHDLVRTRGDRFGIFAVTPMPDIEGSVAEVDRALGELDLDGICLLTNYKGTYLGDPSFAPLYEILNDRGAYVYVHPTGPEVNPAPKLCFGPDIPAGNNVFEYTFDATRAMTSLIYNGVLRDYPNIRWHFTHSGGALPFLAYRLATRHSAFPPFNEVLPEGPSSTSSGCTSTTHRRSPPRSCSRCRPLCPPTTSCSAATGRRPATSTRPTTSRRCPSSRAACRFSGQATPSRPSTRSTAGASGSLSSVTTPSGSSRS